MSQKYGAEHFLRRFPTEDGILGPKTLAGENKNSDIIYSFPSSGRLHTHNTLLTQLQRSTKLKTCH